MKMALAVGAMLGMMGAASAADIQFPAKAVELVVPFPPGGGADTVGRILAKSMSGELGEQMVVLNKPGAAGTIGTAFVAKSAPDGYTILLAQVNSNAVAPNVYKNLPFDADKDFSAIGYIGFSPTVLVANPKVNVKTVAQLVDLAKEKPGSLFYASDGNGAVANIAGELFKQLTGTDITHVPYKGSTPAVADLLGANVSIGFFTMPSLLPNISAGKLTALAIATPGRHARLPDVPTFSEAGLEEFKVQNWYGLVAPAGTPESVIAKLNAALNKALADPDVGSSMSKQGIDLGPAGSAGDFQNFMRQEQARYAKVVKAAHISLD